MEENSQEDIIEVFSGTLWEAEMITSLLKEEGIESFLRNSVLNTYGYNPAFSQEVKVMVMENDSGRARLIVSDYCDNLNFNKGQKKL